MKLPDPIDQTNSADYPFALPPAPFAITPLMPFSINYGTNLLSVFEQNVRDAIRDHGQGEEVAFAVSMTVVPAEQQNQFTPVMVLALSIAGVVLGEKSMATNLSTDLHMTSITVQETVSTMLEAMRAQRSEQLAKTSDLR